MRDTYGGRRDVLRVVAGGFLYRYCFPEKPRT
jgi:hypothetical protein